MDLISFIIKKNLDLYKNFCVLRFSQSVNYNEEHSSAFEIAELCYDRFTIWLLRHSCLKIILHCKYIQCNFYSFKMCPTFHCNLTVRFTFNCCSKYSRIIVNWFTVFKLADRMRSMRTNGASKNQDCPGQNGLIYRLRRNHCYFWYLWYQTVWYVFRYT